MHIYSDRYPNARVRVLLPLEAITIVTDYFAGDAVSVICVSVYVDHRHYLMFVVWTGRWQTAVCCSDRVRVRVYSNDGGPY